jgi:hypothetical protein
MEASAIVLGDSVHCSLTSHQLVPWLPPISRHSKRSRRIGTRFMLFLNRRGAGQFKPKRSNCLNAKLLKRFGCLSPDNAATPAKKREVDLLQWALDPVAEHRSPAEREDLVEPQSIRGVVVRGQ